MRSDCDEGRGGGDSGMRGKVEEDDDEGGWE